MIEQHALGRRKVFGVGGGRGELGTGASGGIELALDTAGSRRRRVASSRRREALQELLLLLLLLLLTVAMVGGSDYLLGGVLGRLMSCDLGGLMCLRAIIWRRENLLR